MPAQWALIIFTFLILKYTLETNFEQITFQYDDFLGIDTDCGRGLNQQKVESHKGGFICYDIDSDDPKINKYDRKKLYYDIRTYIYDIQRLKLYRCIRDGWFWNCWRQVIVLWRTEEADKFDAYLEHISDSLENLSTEKLLYIKRQLHQFWKGL